MEVSICFYRTVIENLKRGIMGLTRFTEVAQSYFPLSKNSHSASCSMSRMLSRCKPLCLELSGLGRRTKDKYLSKAMIDRIYYHLGEP